MSNNNDEGDRYKVTLGWRTSKFNLILLFLISDILFPVLAIYWIYKFGISKTKAMLEEQAGEDRYLWNKTKNWF